VIQLEQLPERCSFYLHQLERQGRDSHMQTPSTIYLGLDIAKLTLDASPFVGLPNTSLPHNAPGHRRLINAITRSSHPVQIICEASGGYEHSLLEALQRAQIPFSLVNPRRVRDFARASGLLAKTDRIDAVVLAKYGQMFHPSPTSMPSPAQKHLKALVVRRQEILGLLTQEERRNEHHHDPFIRRQAQSLQKTLKKHLERIQEEIGSLEQADAVLHEKVQRLSSVQGIGQCTARLLLAALPELGTLERGQGAALAGLAPYNHDSGPFRGQRHIAHGRPLARQALYMAALVAARRNPILTPFYQRLRDNGKPAKVALVALMRKLVELANRLLKDPQFQIA
jgi:transposase